MTNTQKNIRTLSLALFVPSLLVVMVYARQQPKPQPIPLNPAASKAVDDIEAGKKACLEAAQNQEQLILLGANVPKKFQCKRTESGWVCSAPESAKANSSPEKK